MLNTSWETKINVLWHTYLVLGEAHLDDTPAVVAQVERILVVGLPALEVGRVLAVAIAGGNPREKLGFATHLFPGFQGSHKPGS